MKRWILKLISTVRACLHTFAAVGPCCRYEPTCSQYMRQSVEQHGCWRGLGLGVFRILRCAPWGAGGWDPVPPRSPKTELGKEY